MISVADIAAFHEKFGLAYTGGPRELPASLAFFRAQFLVEELNEYTEGLKSGDLEQQLDALVDLVYVAIGTAYLQGFDFDEAWRRVHAANMAKIRTMRAADSKRGSTWDVVKPEGWQPPDLSDLVDTREAA